MGKTLYRLNNSDVINCIVEKSRDLVLDKDRVHEKARLVFDGPWDDARLAWRIRLSHGIFASISDVHRDALVDTAVNYASSVYEPSSDTASVEVDMFMAALIALWHFDEWLDDYKHLTSIRSINAVVDAAIFVLRQKHAVAAVPVFDIPEGGGKFSPQLGSQVVTLLSQHRQGYRLLGISSRQCAPAIDSLIEHLEFQRKDPASFSSLYDYMSVRGVRGGMEFIFKLVAVMKAKKFDPRLEPIVKQAALVTTLTNDLYCIGRDKSAHEPNAVLLAEPDGIATIVALVHRHIHELIEGMYELLRANPEEPALGLGIQTIFDVVWGMDQWHAWEPRYEDDRRLFWSSLAAMERP